MVQIITMEGYGKWGGVQDTVQDKTGRSHGQPDKKRPGLRCEGGAQASFLPFETTYGTAIFGVQGGICAGVIDWSTVPGLGGLQYCCESLRPPKTTSKRDKDRGPLSFRL